MSMHTKLNTSALIKHATFPHLVLLVQLPKDWYRNWRTWREEVEWKPFKLQDYWDRLKYWELSQRLEETCCHSNSSERSSADADVENTHNNNSKALDPRGWRWQTIWVKKRGRWLASIEDRRIDTMTRDYIEKHRGRLITATKNNTDETGISRKQKWEKTTLWTF